MQSKLGIRAARDRRREGVGEITMKSAVESQAPRRDVEENSKISFSLSLSLRDFLFFLSTSTGAIVLKEEKRKE